MKHIPRSSSQTAAVLCAAVFAMSLLIPRKASPAGTFDERGGLVVVEVESEPPASPWVEETFIPGYTGQSYYRLNGNTDRGGTPVGRLSYFININEPGTYRLIMRSYKSHEDESRSNDCYTRMVGHPGYQGSDTKTYLPGPSKTWSWETMHEPGQMQLEPVYTLDAGVHELQISGRSKDFHIDRFVLFADPVTREQAEDLTLPESPLAGDTDPQDSGGTNETDTSGTDPDTGIDTGIDTSDDTGGAIEPYVIEAEHMTFEGFELDPEDPDFIFTRDEGEAWTVFAGEDGFYHVSAVVGLEPDGRPRLALLVGESLVGEAVYERASDTDARFVPHTVELGDAEILKGEEVLLHGISDGEAEARVDKIILTPEARDTGDTGGEGEDTGVPSDSESDTGGEGEGEGEGTQTDSSTQDSDSSSLDTDSETEGVGGGEKSESNGGCGCRTVSAHSRPGAPAPTLLLLVLFELVSY